MLLHLLLIETWSIVNYQLQPSCNYPSDLLAPSLVMLPLVSQAQLIYVIELQSTVASCHLVCPERSLLWLSPSVLPLSFLGAELLKQNHPLQHLDYIQIAWFSQVYRFFAFALVPNFLLPIINSEIVIRLTTSVHQTPLKYATFLFILPPMVLAPHSRSLLSRIAVIVILRNFLPIKNHLSLSCHQFDRQSYLFRHW